jgi:hypothetical protein
LAFVAGAWRGTRWRKGLPEVVEIVIKEAHWRIPHSRR